MTSDKNVLCPPHWGMDGWLHHRPSTVSWTPELCIRWFLAISRWKDVGQYVCLLGLPQQGTKTGWLRTVKFIVSQLEKSEVPNQAVDKALLSLWRAGEWSVPGLSSSFSAYGCVTPVSAFILAWCPPYANVCLLWVMSVSAFLPLIRAEGRLGPTLRAQSYWIRTHSPNFILTWLHGKDLVSKAGHTLLDSGQDFSIQASEGHRWTQNRQRKNSQRECTGFAVLLPFLFSKLILFPIYIGLVRGSITCPAIQTEKAWCHYFFDT